MLAKLEIDFNCMCVFVPEERAAGVGTVHVLMPDTSGHHHAAPPGHHGENPAPIKPHVVRLYHRGVKDALGLKMEGWILKIGDGMADTTLRPMEPDLLGATVVDLTDLTHNGVPRDVLGNTPSTPLASRVSLGLGATRMVRAEAVWWVAGRRIHMAHRLVWHIDGLPLNAPLHWVPLRGRTDSPPLSSIGDIEPDTDGVYRLSIYHVPEDTLPPDPFGAGQLDSDSVREHFRALYRLVGIPNPAPDLLPRPDLGSGGRVNCGIAKASFA